MYVNYRKPTSYYEREFDLYPFMNTCSPLQVLRIDPMERKMIQMLSPERVQPYYSIFGPRRYQRSRSPQNCFSRQNQISRCNQRQNNLKFLKTPKITKPENIKVKIDQEKNLMTVNYENRDGSSVYAFSETKSLPNFIKKENLYKNIKCMVENGNLKVILPKKPKGIENGTNVDSASADTQMTKSLDKTETEKEKNQEPKSMIQKINDTAESVMEAVDEQEQVISENDIVDDTMDDEEIKSDSGSDTELVNVEIVSE